MELHGRAIGARAFSLKNGLLGTSTSNALACLTQKNLTAFAGHPAFGSTNGGVTRFAFSNEGLFETHIVIQAPGKSLRAVFHTVSVIRSFEL